MKKAHEFARSAVTKFATYRLALAEGLRKFHKIAKALAGRIENPIEALQQILINETEPNGYVYLDNAKSEFINLGFSEKQFAGYLSALTMMDLYTKIDGSFGQVKM